MKVMFKKLKNIYFLSFTIPVVLMLGIFIIRGVFPIGDNSFMFSDMYHQYIPFLSEFYHKLHQGESLAYSFYTGLGSNFISLYSYYLGSPENFLVFFCPENLIIEFMTYFIVIKIGLCGFSFSYYLSKRFATKDMKIVWFSVLYAMSGFIAAYSWNHMWMNGLWLTPLIILGLDEMILKGKWRLYCITLAVCIFTNYYISIIICIFLVLYFIMQLFTNGLSIRKKGKAILTFTWTSLLAGGMASVILFPVMNAMHVTDFHQISFPKKIEFYFNTLEIIARHVPMTEAERGLDHWPNIYCGVLVFILIPLYFLHKKITLRQKIGNIFLITIFYLAFSMNMGNFIWHGMNYPDSLPARQSFLYIFLLLVMCFEAVFRNSENGRSNRILSVAVGCILLITCGIFVDTPGFTIWLISCAWVFLAGYVFLYLFTHFILKKKNKIKKLSAYYKGLVLLLICAETVINMEETSVGCVQRDYYMGKISNYETLLNEIQEKTQDDEAFFRIDSQCQMTKNDGTLVGYPSASIFSSTTNGAAKSFYKKLGLGGSKVSYYIKGATPLTQALLGVKYVFSDKDEEQLDENLYTQIASTETMFLYTCKYTLSVGIGLSEERFDALSKNLIEGTGNGLVEQSNFTSELCGNKRIFNMLLKKEVTTENERITVTNSSSGHIYAIVRKEPEGKVTFKYQDVEEELKDYSDDYILDLGRFKKGEQFILEASEGEQLNMSFYRMSDSVLKEAIVKLGEMQFHTTAYTSNSMSGTIEMTSDGFLVLSIPYEPGWTVTVDGNNTEYVKFADTMIAIPMSEGQHEVTIIYHMQGIREGIVLSLLSIGLFILISYKKKKEAYPFSEKVDIINTEHCDNS